MKEVLAGLVKDLTKELFEELKELKEGITSCRHYRTSDAVEEEQLAFNTCTIINEDTYVDTSNDNNNEADSNELIHTARQTQVQKRKAIKRSVEVIKKRRFTVGYHHNKLNVLPPNFEFPSMNVEQLINCWLLGSIEQNVPAYCTLSSKDVMHLKSKKSGKPIGNGVRLKMVAFMKIVEQYARKENVWIEEKEDWTAAKVTKMWDTISDEFKAKFCETSRADELGWCVQILLD